MPSSPAHPRRAPSGSHIESPFGRKAGPGRAGRRRRRPPSRSSSGPTSIAASSISRARAASSCRAVLPNHPSKSHFGRGQGSPSQGAPLRRVDGVACPLLIGRYHSDRQHSLVHHILQREPDRQVERAEAAFQGYDFLAHRDGVRPRSKKSSICVAESPDPVSRWVQGMAARSLRTSRLLCLISSSIAWLGLAPVSRSLSLGGSSGIPWSRTT